jgi:hypothetical protein
MFRPAIIYILIILAGLIVLPLIANFPVLIYRVLKMEKHHLRPWGKSVAVVLLLCLNTLVILHTMETASGLYICHVSGGVDFDPGPMEFRMDDWCTPSMFIRGGYIPTPIMLIIIPLTYYLAIRQNRLYNAAMAAIKAGPEKEAKGENG